MSISQSSVANGLLSALIAKDYALIAPHLTRVPLPHRRMLHKAGEIIHSVYFPEDGIVSVVATAPSGKHVEVGNFGSEGMSATALVLGTDRSPHDVFMQIAGVAGLRIDAAELRRAMAASTTLQGVLLCYVQTVLVQSASSTLAAACYTIEQRLARWLVMCQDRIGGTEIWLTHAFMGATLGTRRSGVTLCLQSLEERGLIATRRGCVMILDRDGLQHLANGNYGFAEIEFERLMGNPLRNSGQRSSALHTIGLTLAA